MGRCCSEKHQPRGQQVVEPQCEWYKPKSDGSGTQGKGAEAAPGVNQLHSQQSQVFQPQKARFFFGYTVTQWALKGDMDLIL